MLITLLDGGPGAVEVFDTEEGKVATAKISHRALRYHIVEEDGTAYKKAVITNTDMQDKILAEVYKRVGRIDSSNHWVKPLTTRSELWRDSERWRRLAQRDLSVFFGNRALVTGTSVRKLYYISDGGIETTPENIGMKFGYPLIYKGYAIATIFILDGKNDPLSPDNNVIYWLTRKQWDGFHSSFRKKPRPYPGDTGFLCTKWCQRAGYSTYRRGGIDLAAMTQAQTVGSWAATSLNVYWTNVLGKSLFTNSKIVKFSRSNNEISERMKKFEYAIRHYPLGAVGLVCYVCGALLPCKFCKCSHGCNNTSPAHDYIDISEEWCKDCGMPEDKCNCGGNMVTVYKSILQAQYWA